MLFTQDDDLLVEAQQRQAKGESFSGVVYGHQMHLTIGECVHDLELIAKIADEEDLACRVEFLPL